MAGPVTRDTSSIALGLAQIRVGASAANIDKVVPVLTGTDSIGSLTSTKFTSTVTFFKHESGFPAAEDVTIPLKEVCSLECNMEEITPFNMALARGLNPKPAATKVITGTGTFDTSKIVFGQGAVNGKTYTLTFTSASAFTITSSGVAFDSGTNSGTISAGCTPTVNGVAVFTIPPDAFGGTFTTGNTVVLSISGYFNSHSGSIKLGALATPADVRMEAVYTFPNGVNTMTILFPRAEVESSPALDLQTSKPAEMTVQFVSKDASSANAAGHVAWDSMPQGTIIFN